MFSARSLVKTCRRRPNTFKYLVLAHQLAVECSGERFRVRFIVGRTNLGCTLSRRTLDTVGNTLCRNVDREFYTAICLAFLPNSLRHDDLCLLLLTFWCCRGVLSLDREFR